MQANGQVLAFTFGASLSGMWITGVDVVSLFLASSAAEISCDRDFDDIAVKKRQDDTPIMLD